VTTRDLLAILAPLPDGATVPVGWLREQLEASASRAEASDLTAAELGQRWRRGVSTIRTLCEGGKLEGAYKFNNREWRIPRATIERHEEEQRQGQGGASSAGPQPAGGLVAIARGKGRG